MRYSSRETGNTAAVGSAAELHICQYVGQGLIAHAAQVEAQDQVVVHGVAVARLEEAELPVDGVRWTKRVGWLTVDSRRKLSGLEKKTMPRLGPFQYWSAPHTAPAPLRAKASTTAAIAPGSYQIVGVEDAHDLARC